MKMRFVFYLLVLPFLMKTVTATPDCQDLAVTHVTAPVSGSGLPYCQVNSLQCCTRLHLLSMKNNISSELVMGVQRDLQTTLAPWMDAYATSAATIDQFVTIFIGIFPFPHNLVPNASHFLNNSVKPTLIHQLHPNFSVDLDFNFERYIKNVTATLTDIFTTNIPYHPQQQQCLNALIANHTSLDAIMDVSIGFRRLQSIFQSMKKIKNFLNGFDVPDTISYTPSDQCLEAIIEQYCSHCVQKIPLLCESTCISLTGACQSPVHDSLQPQLETLWNISRQLILQTQSLMNCSLQLNTLNILPPSALHSIATQSWDDCGIDLLQILGLAPGKRKRSSIETDLIPINLRPAIIKMSSVEGVFNYRNNIPNFCQSRVTLSDCWDGSQVVSNDSISSYSLTIDQQQNNSVYDFDIKELYQQAVLVGTPVISFLQDVNFIMTLPEGIVVPQIIAVTAPPTIATPVSTNGTDRSPTIPVIIVIYPNTANPLYQLNQLTIILCALLLLSVLGII